MTVRRAAWASFVTWTVVAVCGYIWSRDWPGYEWHVGLWSAIIAGFAADYVHSRLMRRQ